MGASSKPRRTSDLTNQLLVASGLVGNGVANDTAALQALLNAAAGRTLFIPKPTTKYLVGELTLPANTRLWIAPGTVFESNASLLTGTKKMFNIGAANVHITGYGATLQMVKAGFASEFNHCISIDQASGKVTVEGLTCNDSGGDGFYVKSPLADVVLRDCKANNNRRQGLSVVEAKSFTDYAGEYNGSTGTGPSCGVDIEPNGAADILGPLRFYGTRAYNNDAAGFLVYLTNWTSVSNVADIEFHGCHSENNAQSTSGTLNRLAGFEVRRIPTTNAPTGRILFVDCVSEEDGYAGFRCWEKAALGPRVDFIRPHVHAANRNASGTSGENAGIVCVCNNATYTSLPGSVRIEHPSVVQKSGGAMVYPVHITSNAGLGHTDVKVNGLRFLGSFSATSPVTVSASERRVEVEYDEFREGSATTNVTITDGCFIGVVLSNRGATGTIAFTLPDATADRIGWEFRFMVAAAQQLNITPGASDRIYPYGSANADPVGSNVRGSVARLRCTAANEWTIIEQSGTWA